MLPASLPVEHYAGVQRHTRLLLVDDDDTTLFLLQRLFADDYELLTANDGIEALALLERETVDLVLLDIQMPRMDGFTCLQHIRQRHTMQALPVIIVSARSETRDVLRGLELGANDYIPKPMNASIAGARVKIQLELKRAHDAQDEMIARLHETQEFQNHFYRIVTHDLKAPLTNLRLGHYMLRDFVGSSEQAHNVLDNMEIAVNSMLEMIHTFLNASKYHQGAFQQQIEVVNAGDLLKRAIEQHRAAAHRKGISLVAERFDCFMLADALMVGQMLDNLISNALKFSAANTIVRIDMEQCNRMLRFRVEDQGPGIAPEERDKLFQMFGRLSPRPTAQESSTGLGLWIVKTLAEMQNGRVGADFPADGGSIFWFELPCA